ncbi:Thiamine pyrophosphate enzyme domain protein TPP-binding [uncultured Sporomusa sp.]|uniref:Thiamine pyrophosphate enzyme domain protein TPP-binding n=1 Tax=uncultured Sporomusa sp. TaxID=307249 RepID=A0A212M1Z5_9FIRM|nr:thiamine pyrophosphate-dependent enzyme [uncultured Sporomusa sp.]SCM83760.1 Thiamine pyrophosphate enzyme domain protein TPP-binding [uncultured Sporomusa sp.]
MKEKIFAITEGLLDTPTHYCPGCHHGIVHRLVAEVITELGVLDKAILVEPVGCSVNAHQYFNMDAVQAAHGRAPAIASAVKRVHPDAVVFTYQGDGDLAAIGCAEIVHAALRGEKFTTIFVNNIIYGMTGGQMAPTTLEGQTTATSPFGRKVEEAGSPMRVSEMLATLDGAKYIARVAVNTPAHLTKAKAAIKEAFTRQLRGDGFTLVEVLATCPTNWGMTPVKANAFVDETMTQVFPLGIIKDKENC